MKIGVSILRVADVAWGTGDKLQGGKYTVERELGRGRFGITYLVRKSNNDRQVVKTLNYDYSFIQTPKLLVLHGAIASVKVSPPKKWAKIKPSLYDEVDYG